MISFFNRIFRKQSSPQISEAVALEAPEQYGEGEAVDISETGLSRKSTHLDIPQLIVGVGQSVGMQRDHNEDALFTLSTNLIADAKLINFGLFMVADGMGGHNFGELASSLAVDCFASHIIDTLYLALISTGDKKLDLSIHELIRDGVKKAHQVIKEQTEGGGTTLTAALILQDQLTVVHVGDSRAYAIDPLGHLHLLTQDHSLVKRLEEIGQISPEQAATHPQRNVLYRALGQGDAFEPDITTSQLSPGTQLMVCSDGLWGVLREPEIEGIIRSSADPQHVCQQLVQAANSAGGPDNISVIIVRFPT